ncbi:MAG: hypothetical protein E7618_01225 [Ruminococcaceae bacterium]|nr:hypothetical protein [Oscillospiraceae bacterium]
MMMKYDEMNAANRELFRRLSVFLNHEPDFVQDTIIRELTEDCGLTEEDAFRTVLAAALGYRVGESREDTELVRRFFPLMIRKADVERYRNDPYYRSIRFPTVSQGRWQLTTQCYQPYEAFVCGDPQIKHGYILPQIGFFDTAFFYPAVLQNGREWMTVTPNEIVTMEGPIHRAKGRVVAYGLGLGYYAFMVARKADVSSVTVIEHDRNSIRLFETYLLPLFPCRDKIRVICADAFDYAEHDIPIQKPDHVFADIWHDPSDGVDAYRRFRSCEGLSPDTVYDYWIEDTLKLYL